MQKIERLVAISMLLQARGKMTAQRLAEILGVSIRTIYRDIVDLSLAHVPIAMDYGPGGGYYLPEDYHFDSAIFTREEAISLVLSADFAGKQSLFAGDDDLHRALFKLEAALPEEYRTDVKLAREHFIIDTTEWCKNLTHPPHLETIRSALLEAHQLNILYPCLACNGLSGAAWRRVEPQGLVFKGLSRRHARAGIWYMVAYCQRCHKFGTFRVSDIEKVTDSNLPVTEHPDFNLRSYWKEARNHLTEQTQTFTMKLRVTAPMRYSLKGEYSILNEEADGSIIVRVEVESFDAAILYALSLGTNATVISPRKVCQALVARAQSIAAMYISLPPGGLGTDFPPASTRKESYHSES
jgi:predicted DNA-binding transcriptional regulator YafY